MHRVSYFVRYAADTEWRECHSDFELFSLALRFHNEVAISMMHHPKRFKDLELKEV